MYTLTFNRDTINDLLAHREDGRQLFAAIVIPYSGIFSHKENGSSVNPPRIVCPYQVNDILAIQERWAQNNRSYVYATDTDADTGFSFRPAYTMPVAAARMYARIVSIKPWSVTKDIAAQYLTIGLNIDKYAGAAKVIGYYDRGTELLSTIRSKWNKDVLNKTYQPYVSSDLPMVNAYLPYYLREPVTYTLEFQDEVTGYSRTIKGPTTQIAQAYDGDTQILKSGTTIDKNHGAWQLVTMTEAQAAEYSVRVPDQLIRRGEWYWSPDEPTASDPKKYVYVVADQFGKPYIRPRYYVTEIVDPDLYWSAWMVSAYLCNKEGEIIGNWF